MPDFPGRQGAGGRLAQSLPDSTAENLLALLATYLRRDPRHLHAASPLGRQDPAPFQLLESSRYGIRMDQQLPRQIADARYQRSRLECPGSNSERDLGHDLLVNGHQRFRMDREEHESRNLFCVSHSASTVDGPKANCNKKTNPAQDHVP